MQLPRQPNMDITLPLVTCSQYGIKLWFSRGYKVQLQILTRIMRVMCQLSASPSRISYMATTLASSTSKYPNCLALEPAVLSSLSPFLKPLLTPSTCILIPQASSSCLELLSKLLLGGSCEGPSHLLHEVQVGKNFSSALKPTNSIPGVLRRSWLSGDSANNA